MSWSNSHPSSSKSIQSSLLDIEMKLDKCHLNYSKNTQEDKNKARMAMVAPIQRYDFKPMFPKK